MLFPTSRSLCRDVLQNGRRDNIERKGVKSVDFLWSQRDLSLTWRVRPHGRSMPYARAVRQWEIRPTSTLRGIKRTRALMWQRIRGLVRACRHGAGYPVNYNDPEREEQEMVCLEVWMCSFCFFCLFFSIAFLNCYLLLYIALILILLLLFPLELIFMELMQSLSN